MKIKNKIWFGSLFFISLLITALGQPDRNFIFPLIAYIFGYAIFVRLLLEVKSTTRRIGIAFLWYSGVELFQLNWLATTHYHGFGIVVVYLVIALSIALQFAVVISFLPIDKSLSVTRSLVIASIWTIVEFSRLFYLCGFPFNTIGLILTFNTLTLQLVGFFGIYGLTFFVIFTSIIGGWVFKEPTCNKLILWLTVLAFPFIFGYAYIKCYENKNNDIKTIDVALIQTGLFSEEKWPFENMKYLFIHPIKQWERIFEFLKNTGIDKFDLIVLPEVAVTGNLNEVICCLDDEKITNSSMTQKLANLYSSEIVIGLLDFDHNSAYHFKPLKKFIDKYDKRVLVPMAEYLPFPIGRSFLEKFGINSWFSPGIEAKVFDGKVKMAPSICYEEGFGGLIREGRAQGAEMLINLTNDVWFPNSRLPIEHFNIGRVRAVENGVPLLRACNNGITAAVDSFGRTCAIMKNIDCNGKLICGALTSKIACNSHNTLFTIVGDSLIIGISLFIICCGVVRKNRSCFCIFKSICNAQSISRCFTF